MRKRGSPPFLLAIGLLLSTAVEADCRATLSTDALQAGIGQTTVEHLLGEARQLDQVLRLDRSQPEFSQTFADYLDGRADGWRLRRGRRLLQEQHELLAALQVRYGITPEIIVALWGLETNFGGNFGSFAVIDALFTLACDGRRSDFFRAELLSVLGLVDTGKLDAGQLRGSWTGAMGHMQFMPSTIAAHAADHDGSGAYDLWRSLDDALGSAAAYLQSAGWRAGHAWGEEVELASGFDWSLAGSDRPRPLIEWRQLGVRPSTTRELRGGNDEKAALLLPAGRHGPAFLVYDNFRVLLDWNASTFYALAVGILADRIGGGEGLHRPPPDERALRRGEIEEIQQRLLALGHDSGGADGIIGPATRAAVRSYQQASGLPADGHPNHELLDHLRNHPAFHATTRSLATE